jgi:hypothetical protein
MSVREMKGIGAAGRHAAKMNIERALQSLELATRKRWISINAGRCKGGPSITAPASRRCAAGLGQSLFQIVSLQCGQLVERFFQVFR